jgi:hypothetical protein
MNQAMNMKRINDNSRVPILAKWIFCCFFTLLTANISDVVADDTLTTNDVSANWEQASDSELDALRGGFQLSNGLNIDFSFEKVILMNGVVTSTTSFQLPENMTLLQSGNQNVQSAMQGSQFNSEFQTIIQNDVDNRTIQTMKTIDIQLSNLKNLENYSKDVALQNFIHPF